VSNLPPLGGQLRDKSFNPLIMVETEFRHTKFREMSEKVRRIFSEISYFCEFLVKFHQREIFFPTSHTFCYSFEHIKLKLLLLSKLNLNFAVRNIGKISQHFPNFIRNFAKLQNLREISYPPYL
jgi:hypothetical protein